MHTSKIYVLLPANVCSGGPELGHQLLDYLRRHGRSAYVVYISNGQINSTANIPEVYQDYDVEISHIVEDVSDNIIVIPETMSELIHLYKQARILFWWMSVDNFTKKFLDCQPLRWDLKKTFWQNAQKNIHIMLKHIPIPKINILAFLRDNKDRILHLYQSEYAHQYILEHKLGESVSLSDYINEAHIPKAPIDYTKKENVILYNPAKGLEFTEKIIRLLPEYEFVALRGLTREQLNQQFDRAKMYIDFGNFPGKDRLPRECALHDCCIITGKLGASAYYEDVPIPDCFKFETTEENLEVIELCIHDVMNHYEDYIKQFSPYKDIIKGEQKRFYSEIDAIFL